MWSYLVYRSVPWKGSFLTQLCDFLLYTCSSFSSHLFWLTEGVEVYPETFVVECSYNKSTKQLDLAMNTGEKVSCFLTECI